MPRTSCISLGWILFLPACTAARIVAPKSSTKYCSKVTCNRPVASDVKIRSAWNFIDSSFTSRLNGFTAIWTHAALCRW